MLVPVRFLFFFYCDHNGTYFSLAKNLLVRWHYFSLFTAGSVLFEREPVGSLLPVSPCGTVVSIYGLSNNACAIAPLSLPTDVFFYNLQEFITLC